MKTIGRKEYVCFPGLGLRKVIAKIDTGAYTSSLHCSSVKEIEVNGKPLLKVTFLDATEVEVEQEFEDFSSTKVRSSTGKAQKRYVVKTKIKLGGRSYTTNITLANRSKMRCPVLLGRKLLNNNFIVDVSKEFELA